MLPTTRGLTETYKMSQLYYFLYAVCQFLFCTQYANVQYNFANEIYTVQRLLACLDQSLLFMQLLGWIFMGK